MLIREYLKPLGAIPGPHSDDQLGDDLAFVARVHRRSAAESGIQG